MMKTLGVVGGLGPESTIDYYRFIISFFREKTGEGYPPIIINSLDLDRGIRLVTANQLSELTEYLVGALRQLAAAGADFALMSANTPHVVFNEVRQQSPLPLISIVEATCEEVKRRRLKRVSLLGTGFTMKGRFYPEVFSREGVELIPPALDEQDYIHDKYLNELVRGTFLPATAERFREIIATQVRRDGVEAIVLAGTELPLLLRNVDVGGVDLLDTTQIHVRAAVQEMMR